MFLLASLLSPFWAGAQDPYIVVLGTAQDGGYPHIGCERECCAKAWQKGGQKAFVVSLALVDPASGQWWLFEATPDLPRQLQLFKTSTGGKFAFLPSGIFITHAHIGHYAGLMQLGREALGAKAVPVWVLPRMKSFLESNGPWSQLVKLKNIELKPLDTLQALVLNERIRIESFTVPHRDEFSETAGFRIKTSARRYLFIPDIDKWSKWHQSIVGEVQQSDIAFLDATFYSLDELAWRNVTEVPHPTVAETMALFAGAAAEEKRKIHFIHLNHTNPLGFKPQVKQQTAAAGFRLAGQGMKY